MKKHNEQQIAARLSDSGVRDAVMSYYNYHDAFNNTSDEVTCLRLNEITNFADWKQIRELAFNIYHPDGSIRKENA